MFLVSVQIVLVVFTERLNRVYGFCFTCSGNGEMGLLKCGDFGHSVLVRELDVVIIICEVGFCELVSGYDQRSLVSVSSED